MQSQKPTTGTPKKAGTMSSNPNDGKQDDVMVFGTEQLERSSVPLSRLATALRGVDQGVLVALTIDMLDQGVRSDNPGIHIARRAQTGTQGEKEFIASYAHDASYKGRTADVISALWITDKIVVITGTRELASFAAERDFRDSAQQMMQLATALRGVQNARKGAPSNRLFFASANGINPMKPSRGDIVSVLVSLDDGIVSVLDTPAGGLIMIDIDPARRVVYALRFGADGARKQIVEANLSELQVMPELLTRPFDDVDWHVVVTPPKDRDFYYASRTNRVDGHTYRSLALTFVGGYTATIDLTGRPISIKPSDLTYVGSFTCIGRFRSLFPESTGMGVVLIDSTNSTGPTSTVFRGGSKSVPDAYLPLLGGRASAPAA